MTWFAPGEARAARAGRAAGAAYDHQAKEAAEKKKVGEEVEFCSRRTWCRIGRVASARSAVQRI
eukprot:3522771-Lingulodinium_polyedra.AAC.1